MARSSKISLCMIVRDEERFLERCLLAAAPLVDEICIVDTGSTDGSVAIARAHGARVRQIVWPEDFAAARNVSLEMATGDWILVLDADEVLRPEGAAELDRLVDRPDVVGAHVLVTNHYEAGRILECFVLRLFRNRPEHRFAGVIHEQIVHALRDTAEREGGRIVETRIALDHHGYREDTRRERRKDDRDRPLFDKALRERPDDAYLWFKLGDFLRRFPDRAAVTAALDRCCEAAALPGSPWSDAVFVPVAHALVALELLEAGETRAAAARVARADALGLPSPFLHWVAGHVALRTGDCREAESRFRACHAYDGRPSHLPAPPGITGGRAVFGIARALLGSGRDAEARALFLDGAERWPDCVDLVKAAARIEAERRRPQEALARLGKLLAREREDAEAWRIGAEILLELGLEGRARTFLARAREHARGEEVAACAALAAEIEIFGGRAADLSGLGDGGRAQALRMLASALAGGAELELGPHAVALLRRLARSSDPRLAALLATATRPAIPAES